MVNAIPGRNLPFLNFAYEGISMTKFNNLGSLSNDDGSGCINVSQEVNLRCFKLHCSSSNSFNLSNVGDFSGVEF